MKMTETRDFRYMEQQKKLDEIAERLGVVAYRPSYHGDSRDKNTVLFYTKPDAEYNERLEREKGYVPNEMYRTAFFFFENTDSNGFESYQFANHGKIDLRGINYEQKLEGFIQLALLKKEMYQYVRSCGGYLGIREADEYYNDLNRAQIHAFWMAHGSAFLGDINLQGELYQKAQTEDVSIFREYHEGDLVYNFGCVFAVPREDDKLNRMILDWNRDHRLPKSVSSLDEFHKRVEQLGGIEFVWY